MAEHRTPALVLRTFDQGESHRILHLYTEALGRVSAVAMGARRSRRRFPGTLEPLTIVDALLVERSSSGLARLDGATLVRSFEPLVSSLGRYAVACELIEILERFTGEREPSAELFRFATGVLDVVGEEIPDRLLGLLVLTKTLARLGYRPRLGQCAQCGAELRTGRGRAAFAPRHGGALCARCAEPEDLRVEARVLAGLEAGIGLPLRERWRSGLRESDLPRAEMLLDRFFEFHLGAQLRSAAFLREIVPLELDAARSRGDTAPRARPLARPAAGPANRSASPPGAP